jgi:hypothetical protein
MNGTIFLKDALTEMRMKTSEGMAVKFDISVRSYNKNSKEGGKMYHYINAKLVMEEGNLTKEEKEINSLKFKKSTQKRIQKNPLHFNNKTRNIKLEDNNIKKININYIILFNGEKVIY